MPHRRRVQKGSFGTHFDELVKHFPSAHRTKGKGETVDDPAPKEDERSVHDKLFDGAWRKSR